jgi:hypothetical protein
VIQPLLAAVQESAFDTTRRFTAVHQYSRYPRVKRISPEGVHPHGPIIRRDRAMTDGCLSLRRHAAECLRIADDTTNPQNKILPIAMAQAWLRLAQQAEQNLTTDLVGTPLGAKPSRVP